MHYHSQTNCAACSDGQYSAQSGAAECDICPIGSYCNDSSALPEPCPAGHSCLQGQTGGTPCSTGYQTTLTGQSYCKICSPGIYI